MREMQRLKEYNSQLEAVEQSLALTEEDSAKTSLINLREHLLELIDLTIASSKTEEDIPAEELKSDNLTISDAHKEYDPESNLKSSLQLLREQLELMVGAKCSAPHKHSWGSIVYHNAIICGIGEDVEMEGDIIANAHLRVLFTNPTHQEMLPCTYFLDGSCKFNATNCHYSHGELIPFDHLREYTEPNFEKLSSNCGVLAKMKDQLWHKGRVININFVKHMCRVRLDGNQYEEKEVDFPFENLFPIFNDEDLSSESDIDSDSCADSTIETGTGKSHVGDRNLLAVAVHDTLGQWEKYTRGIGSKLLAKMGYVQGSGLGCGGTGIVTPIAARVYPQRCSLDHCMKLREASESVVDEVCVKKSRKMMQDASDTKLNGNESHHEDVFSFLNDTILKNAKEDSQPCSSRDADKSLQNQTTKTLNVESVRVADSIRKKQYEIIKVRESLRRSTKATDVHMHLLSQLNIKANELNELRRREQLLTKEQKTRKDTEKLCIF